MILACRNRNKAEAAIADIQQVEQGGDQWILVSEVTMTKNAWWERSGQRAVQCGAASLQETGSTDVAYMHLDLASLKSVHCFCQNFLKAESRLDLLINNAGTVRDV